jgi:nitrite reductase/ring-hydroxylating ferredoxin subunit
MPDIYVVYLEDRKRRISVARVGDRLYAFDDLCTCAGDSCPLSGGLLTGTTIMCQCHGSEFDIVTGAVVRGPASVPLNVYDARVVDGSISISVLSRWAVRAEFVQCCAQLAARADIQLGVDLAEVPLDRPHRQEQLGADLGVGAAIAGSGGR